MRYPTIAQHSWYTSPLHLLCSYPMIHILFNISIFMNYIDQRYWKLSLFSISWPSSLTTPLIMFLLLLNIHPMYFVLTLLNRKPLDSKVSHQISNLPLTLLLVSSTKTISSANSIHQRTSSWIDLVSSSITSAKRYGEVNPWCKLVVIGNLFSH